MDTGILNMLGYGRYQNFAAIRHGVKLNFVCIFDKLTDDNGVFT